MVKLNRSDSGPRLYRGEGFAVPSVTTVLQILEKKYLEAWRHRVGRKEADRVMITATVLGTQVHSLANKLVWEDRLGATKVPADLELYALALRSFFTGHVAEPIKTELSLVSQRERVGGTLDLYCRLQDGSLAVVDYKTSAQLSREHGLQTALYALLLREHGYEVNQRLVVRVKKDKPGEFYVREYKDHEGDVKAARACVELYWWQNRNKIAKTLEAA
ncbi:MAG: PD-(D/E)XK nuclease family protein [Rubrobacteraceae bacterium]